MTPHQAELFEGPSYRGRATLVTGAGAGIGREIALAFAAAGSPVVCADRDEQAALDTTALIVEAGGAATPVACDVADESSVAGLGAAVRDGGGVSVIVNVAGIFDRYTPTEEMSLELWNRVLGVNLTGSFLICRELLPDMADRGGGSVVNIASICGVVAGAGGVAYTASKHGVIGLTRQLADEWGPRGVRVNAICPGVIAAGMTLPHIDASGGVADAATLRTPARRMGTAREVAGLAIYLAGSEADFIQGAAIPVDGGWTAI